MEEVEREKFVLWNGPASMGKRIVICISIALAYIERLGLSFFSILYCLTDTVLTRICQRRWYWLRVLLRRLIFTLMFTHIQEGSTLQGFFLSLVSGMACTKHKAIRFHVETTIDESTTTIIIIARLLRATKFWKVEWSELVFSDDLILDLLMIPEQLLPHRSLDRDWSGHSSLWGLTINQR